AEIGVVKNATKEAAINVECNEKEIFVKVYVTAIYENATVQIFQNETLIKEFTTGLSPRNVFHKTINKSDKVLKEEINVVVKHDDKILVSYHPETNSEKEIPPPAKAVKKPGEIDNNELLYLNGLHLEQYRHATFSPLSYYQEALKRDAGDVRNNNALGLWFLRKGKIIPAKPYFKKAIERLTERNPNPNDGEPFYNLGLCQKMQGNVEEAYNNFYKATWNDAWQHAAFFQLARIACIKNDFADALYLIDKSITRNYHSHSARHLKAVVLRKLGKPVNALDLINESLVIDRFNYGCLFEQYLLSTDTKETENTNALLKEFTNLVRNSFNNYLEYALDYAQAGLFEEAISLLKVYEGLGNVDTPLLYYYLGWFYTSMHNKEIANSYYKKASSFSPDYCFPNKIEDMLALEQAVRLNPVDSKAFYYLGNYWYANRQYDDAITCWEKSIALDNTYPTAFRNLSLAYYNKQQKYKESISLLEKAFELDDTDSRVLMELDQLYKIQNYSHEHRLDLLEKHLDLVAQRDDLYLERITLYNQSGNYEKAAALIAARKFHPWEGGEGKVVYQFLLCHIEMAKAAIADGRNERALELLANVEEYPINMGEGKLYGTQENDIHYLQGCAYEAMGVKENAKEKFVQATKGISEPVLAIFYNDPQPDNIFYQGLAWLKLGDENKAKKIFEKLISFAAQHLNDKIEIDYFAVSLPDLLVFDQDLSLKNKVHCDYLTGLGLLGLYKTKDAKKYFKNVLAENINHQGAGVHLKMVEFLARENKIS
ncbi:MAG: tetratricopeptide repeat protein, partial [Segetibacter sp.]